VVRTLWMMTFFPNVGIAAQLLFVLEFRIFRSTSITAPLDMLHGLCCQKAYSCVGWTTAPHPGPHGSELGQPAGRVVTEYSNTEIAG